MIPLLLVIFGICFSVSLIVAAASFQLGRLTERERWLRREWMAALSVSTVGDWCDCENEEDWPEVIE